MTWVPCQRQVLFCVKTEALCIYFLICKKLQVLIFLRYMVISSPGFWHGRPCRTGQLKQDLIYMGLLFIFGSFGEVVVAQWRFFPKTCAVQPVIHDLNTMNSKVRKFTSDTKFYKQSQVKLSAYKGAERFHDTDKMMLNINKFSATDCYPPAYSKQVFFLPSASGSEEKTLIKSFSIYSIQFTLILQQIFLDPALLLESEKASPGQNLEPEHPPGH